MTVSPDLKLVEQDIIIIIIIIWWNSCSKNSRLWLTFKFFKLLIYNTPFTVRRRIEVDITILCVLKQKNLAALLLTSIIR